MCSGIHRGPCFTVAVLHVPSITDSLPDYKTTGSRGWIRSFTAPAPPWVITPTLITVEPTVDGAVVVSWPAVSDRKANLPTSATTGTESQMPSAIERSPAETTLRTSVTTPAVSST